MLKQVLERFVAKYNLAGAAESVLWTTTKKSLATRFISDDKNVLGVVSTADATFEEGDYGIYDTAQLNALLGTLDADIQIKPVKTNGKIASLQLRDAVTKVTFMLADKSVIPPVPDLKTLPPFDMEIALDAKFINTFVRGKNALPDVETFTVLTEGEKTQVVIGFSPTLNTNRVAFAVEVSTGKGIDRAINFSARYLKDILLANKEAESGTLKISPKGLAYVTFKLDGFTAEYYLVEIQTA